MKKAKICCLIVIVLLFIGYQIKLDGITPPPTDKTKQSELHSKDLTYQQQSKNYESYTSQPKDTTQSYPSQLVYTDYRVSKLFDYFHMSDSYDIDSLFACVDPATDGLVKFFNFLYPKTKADKTEKIAHVLNGDLSGMLYKIEHPIANTFMLYKAVSEAEKIFDSDSTFISEITAWQTLNKSLDEYVENSIIINDYSGMGTYDFIVYTQTHILEKRMYDLQRINKIFQGGSQQKSKASSLDIAKNRLEKTLKVQSRALIYKSNVMANDGEIYYGYTKKDYREDVKAVKKNENSVLNALNDWLNVRDSLQNTFTDDNDRLKYINSTIKLLDDLSVIIHEKVYV